MNLVIDVGNSRTKLAIFKKSELKELFILDSKEVLDKIKKTITNYKVNNAIIAKVSDVSNELLSCLRKSTNLIVLDYNSNLPFENLYKTPKTLGIDRIVLASAAALQFKNKNVLIIDAGTCVTYDFINKKSQYKGGAISPGLTMRYKSLNAFTAKLPNLNIAKPKSFIGNTTDQSIHSGVVNGLIQEIDGVINQYKKKYSDLTVVLTGGDTKFLSKQLKSSIFANRNFLLEGLNDLLIFIKNKWLEKF